ncbi:MAG TPA: hypothetical protein VJ417_08235, partial [Candidatus Glassbacteria bacterium]|nr:hypothetical protein [Candidatus Glassbacteria bacterium]
MKAKLIAPLMFALVIFTGLAHTPLQAQAGLQVMKSDGEAKLASAMFYNYLTDIAWKYLAARQDEIAAIRTQAQ